jgi:ABC-type multidrug transport system ATPase subunit
MNPVLEFEDVSRSCGNGKPVLNGVSFSVALG